MSGIENLNILLKEMRPFLDDIEYVFCTKKIFELNEEILSLKPICTFLEEEGMTFIILKEKADEKQISYNAVFNKITLEVHSSLEAVGLTSAISTALSNHNISANVVAGFYHDHIFVSKDKSLLALEVLKKLSEIK
ncbi:ACT domain-containing protein [Arcobacter sp. LA11]|uniref:ACT domain-containing protein n=1 Tax=Arcobacter sp. LA11 TaxID=1898176 RepID=UPI0009320FD4|nr:ACT domain-containing protein [Arcobacter sp. LA11]